MRNSDIVGGAWMRNVLLIGCALVLAVTGTYAVLQQGAPISIYAVSHGLCFVGALIVWLRAGEKTELLLLLVLTGSMGPFGALAFLAAAAGMSFGRQAPNELARWHNEISGLRRHGPADALVRTLDAGRITFKENAPPMNFDSTLREAPRIKRLLVLGMMARHYDRRLLPHILSGLTNDDPLVRSQAAVLINRLPEEDQRTVRMPKPARQRNYGK